MPPTRYRRCPAAANRSASGANSASTGAKRSGITTRQATELASAAVRRSMSGSRSLHRQRFDVRCRVTDRPTTVSVGEFRPSRRCAWPSARRAVGSLRGQAAALAGRRDGRSSRPDRPRRGAVVGRHRPLDRPGDGERVAGGAHRGDVPAGGRGVRRRRLRDDRHARAARARPACQPRRPSIRLETKRLTRRQTRQAVAIDRRAFGAPWANDAASLAAIRRATPTYRARQLSVDGSSSSRSRSAASPVRPATCSAWRSIPATSEAGGASRSSPTRCAGCTIVTSPTRSSTLRSATSPALALYDQFGFRQRADRLTIAELDLTRRG